MTARPLPASGLVAGVADYDRPRRPRVELTAKSLVCVVCETDNEVSPCPANCLTRGSGQRGRL